MKWNMISTGDIALRKGGSVDPKKHQDEVFELYSIPAFDAGAPEVVAGSAIGSSKKAVQPNDVMISRIVPHIRRACVVGPAKGHRQIASGEWIIFRDERIWPKYFRWLLVEDVFHSAFMRTVSGVGGSLLRARPAEVFKIQIPLPPLAEQKRIAGILDAADALRAKRREALAQLDTLLQSTFLDMFGDPVTNPMGWVETPFWRHRYRYEAWDGAIIQGVRMGLRDSLRSDERSDRRRILPARQGFCSRRTLTRKRLRLLLCDLGTFSLTRETRRNLSGKCASFQALKAGSSTTTLCVFGFVLMLSRGLSRCSLLI